MKRFESEVMPHSNRTTTPTGGSFSHFERQIERVVFRPAAAGRVCFGCCASLAPVVSLSRLIVLEIDNSKKLFGDNELDRIFVFQT